MLKWLKRILLLLLLLAVATFGMLVGSQNGEAKVALQFGEWTSPEIALFYWIGIGFAVGFLLGGLLLMASNVRYRLRARGALNQVDKLNAELDQLQTVEPTAVP